MLLTPEHTHKIKIKIQGSRQPQPPETGGSARHIPHLRAELLPSEDPKMSQPYTLRVFIFKTHHTSETFNLH